MKKSIQVFIALCLIIGVIVYPFTFVKAGNKVTSSNTNDSNMTVRNISYLEFIEGIAKTHKISIYNAIKLDAAKKKEFAKSHSGLFSSSSSNSTSGHYEYKLYSRYEYFGNTYWEGPYAGEESGPIYIRQSVYAEIYVYDSFRQFVWADNPFTEPYSGGYAWHETYSRTILHSPPISFTALSSGYAEVAISSSLQLSIGADLEGAGFNLSVTRGSTYYYRKFCDFPQWDYSLY